jgi:hypothetical protein
LPIVGVVLKKARSNPIPIVEFIKSHSKPIARELTIFVKYFLKSGSSSLFITNN